MEIGQRIVALRESREWSQRELARRVGLDKAVMHRIETGSRPVKDQELVKLSEVFDVSTDYLLGIAPKVVSDEEVERILNDPQTDLMFSDWKNMSEEQREEAIKMIKWIIFKDGQ